MATFYKYKERDDISKSMIDWSGITKEISDNLMKEKERRENLKFEIEQDQNEKLKAIDEYAKGLDPTMNQAMQKYAQNYKDYLLNSHRLMRQGLVSVNDTKIKKQGAMDTFNALNEVTKTYNEKIGAFIETGGSLNDFMAKNVAGALDIRNSQIMIDDMGRGSLVTLDENGNEVIVPVTSVNTILNKKFNRFDTTGEVLNTVKGIADWTKTFGGYRSVSDFRQRGEDFYKKTIESKVDAILNSDRKILEAASDMMNMEVTYDENLYKENPEKYILAKNQGGEITFDVDKQKVKDRLYNEIDAAIGRTETQTPYRPTSAEISSRAGRKTDKEVSSLIEKFVVNADFSALKSALAQKGFQGSTAPDENGIIRLINSNGESLSVETKDRNAKQVGQEIAGFLKVGEYFKERNITANLNPGVLDANNKSNYGIFVSAPTQKFDTVENRSYVYDKLEDMGMALTGEARQKEVAQRMQNIVGNKADITYRGDDVIINGTQVITNGINNAAKVFSAIDNISTRSNTTSNTNLNASERSSNNGG